MKKLTYKHITALQRVEIMLRTTAEGYADRKVADALEKDAAFVEDIRQHLHKAISQPHFMYPPDGKLEKF